MRIANLCVPTLISVFHHLRGLSILKMYKVLLMTIIFLFSPHYLALEEGIVLEYGPDNFKQQIKEKDGNFIMFYAPWCRHCTDLYPIWSELAQMVNLQDSHFAIAQVDCTKHFKLCHENDITGYPSLLYFQKNSFTPVEYKNTNDLPSLSLFLSEVFTMKSENYDKEIPTSAKYFSGVIYLNDQNIDKIVSKGQHFIMFYAPWCKASQRLALIWEDLGDEYAYNQYIQIGKVNCMESEYTCENFNIKQYPTLLWIADGRVMGVAEAGTLAELKQYVQKMLLSENHDPEKFMKKKKVLPVARIYEETFETFMQKDLVYVNYFAPWCAHCMQLSPLWLQLGRRFQNESRVLIADVNCAHSKSICEMEKIHGLPTLILYKNKEIVNIEKGGRSLESLISTVNEHLHEKTEHTAPEQEQQKDEL